MKRNKNISRLTASEMRTQSAQSLTDWNKVDAITDHGLDVAIASDLDESGLVPDWVQAKLVLPEPKLSVNLRLDREIVDFFKGQGRGHISRMQAVLKAYVDAHSAQSGFKSITSAQAPNALAS